MKFKWKDQQRIADRVACLTIYGLISTATLPFSLPLPPLKNGTSSKFPQSTDFRIILLKDLFTLS